MPLLNISTTSGLESSNAGLFISAGSGSHPDRVLDSFELILVRSGRLNLVEENREFDLATGDSLLLWPHKRHRGGAPYESDTSFYWAHFYFRSHTTRNNAGSTLVRQHVRLGNPLRLVELFHRFLNDQENGVVSANYFSVLLKLMLLEIAIQDGKAADSTSARTLASAAQALIAKGHRERSSTARLAEQLNCNPDYLGRVYKETFGITLTTGIHTARMHHAKSLLLLSSMSIKQIAAVCGYENPDYFRRIFRRHYDMQPAQFRSLHLRQHTNSV
jgi:AraC-like DNA-binding protein